MKLERKTKSSRIALWRAKPVFGDALRMFRLLPTKEKNSNFEENLSVASLRRHMASLRFVSIFLGGFSIWVLVLISKSLHFLLETSRHEG